MCLMRDVNGPHIIIVPKSTLSNWMAEFKRWCPSLIIICLIGNQEERVRPCQLGSETIVQVVVEQSCKIYLFLGINWTTMCLLYTISHTHAHCLQTRIIQEEILPGEWNVVVTSYEMVLREKATFKKLTGDTWSSMKLTASRMRNQRLDILGH